MRLLFNALLIICGAFVAIMGRHSVMGLVLGFGMMAIGWCGIERKEGRS